MELIKILQLRGCELIAEGEQLLVTGELTDDDRVQIRQHKPEIMAALSKAGQPGNCENCKASGFWDLGEYTGKMLCFHRACFLGKSGKPTPCDQARLSCPLKIIETKNKGEKNV